MITENQKLLMWDEVGKYVVATSSTGTGEATNAKGDVVEYSQELKTYVAPSKPHRWFTFVYHEPMKVITTGGNLSVDFFYTTELEAVNTHVKLVKMIESGVELNRLSDELTNEKKMCVLEEEIVELESHIHELEESNLITKKEITS